MPLKIEDYALIGDTQTAALVGRDGSVDWLCLPSFDSPACFAALLGDPSHGRWLLAPHDEVSSTARRYRGNSLVLETEFTTSSGTVRVVDCMPPRERDPDLVRVVEGIRGEVKMRMELIVRFDYGSIVPWVRHIDGTWLAIGGPDAVSLWSPVPLEGKDFRTEATFTVREGERVQFLLMWHPSNEGAKQPAGANEAVDHTCDWWERWCEQCTYDGEWRDDVLRSLIVLKALTFEPTGGIVAAPTTSLPERIGGVRNWDYRYCWLRDATFTLYSLLSCGFTSEAASWRAWLLRAAAGDPSALQIMYGPRGERRLTELELSWLPGYENSKPVRIGNAAVDQRQLDVYGEVMDALYLAIRDGVSPDPAAWALQCLLVDYVERIWQEPDEGIWEVRGPRRHFTHSKVMAWVAVDRAIKTVQNDDVTGPLEKWIRLRDEIHHDVCTKGFNESRGAFTQYYGSDELDASLLAVPLVGFLPVHDRRVAGTTAAIERELIQHGFVRRYRGSSTGEVDGLPAGEGAFLPCTYWLCDNYALAGRRDEARALFERLLAIRNDLGLLSEEYDPVQKRLLGNFPQAFSHVSLINTALNLTRRRGPAQDRGAGGGGD
jgi:GH15 family glucan-1,4-alpha-glucosidase